MLSASLHVLRFFLGTIAVVDDLVAVLTNAPNAAGLVASVARC